MIKKPVINKKNLKYFSKIEFLGLMIIKELIKDSIIMYVGFIVLLNISS